VTRAALLLGREGSFSRALPGYEVRSGQLEVADAVEAVLESDGVLLCEAGTGIGKTFAYLVPAVQSGRKIVISTATRALQDQIAGRDLPTVQRVLGRELRVTVMKGLSNYLCRRRYREFLLSAEALRPTHARELELVRSWLEVTETGDLSELATMRDSSPVRLAVASSSETRVGANCPHYDECFVTRMKREAEQAELLIVNHHLFFADLALRGAHPARVLPEYDAVILDEAHQVEDTAATFFGARVGAVELERLARDAERSLARATSFGGPLDPSAGVGLVAELRKAAHAFALGLARRTGDGRVMLSRESLGAELGAPRHLLEARMADLTTVLRGRAGQSDDQAQREGLELLARRTETLRGALTEIVEGAPGRVSWLEVSGADVSLASTPVELAPILARHLFDVVPAVALLSATLSTSARAERGFEYVRTRLGLDETRRVRELSVPSPFDFASRCVLYLADDLPAPGTPAFSARAAARIAELAELVDGGAFVLTTSLASMQRLHAELAALLPGRAVWVQGERPRNALLATFRAHGKGVLVATSGFWEGIDVPGSALRLVVLEKLPFAVPTDPVFQARAQALEAAGKSAFSHLALPGAAIALKQGFGRLIRRQDDVGVVALLDDRVLRRGYGKRLLGALPPALRTSSLLEVEQAVARWGVRRSNAPSAPHLELEA
jgi:ATP-dependent DNA helicase DinG